MNQPPAHADAHVSAGWSGALNNDAFSMRQNQVVMPDSRVNWEAALGT